MSEKSSTYCVKKVNNEFKKKQITRGWVEQILSFKYYFPNKQELVLECI